MSNIIGGGLPIINSEIFDRPKGVDVEFCEQMEKGAEIRIYLAINALDALLATLAKGAAEAKEKGAERREIMQEIGLPVAEATVKRQYAVQQTKRFGVHFDRPDAETSEEFRQWFFWWDRFIQKRITPEGWEELKAILESDADVSQLQPPGDWRPDPNAYRNGAVPADWLLIDRTLEEAEVILKSQGVLLSSSKWVAFKEQLRDGDELWQYQEKMSPENADRPKAMGFCIVTNKRPAITFQI